MLAANKISYDGISYNVITLELKIRFEGVSLSTLLYSRVSTLE